MAKKPKNKAKTEESPEDAAGAKSGGSRKMLLAAAAMCLLSLGGGFYLARIAYLEDAQAFEPDYKTKDDEHAADAHGKDDGHGKKDKKELRKDITDPLAKDGHDAGKASALQAKSDDGHGGKGGKAGMADSGLLEFGDILTNISGFDAGGQPKRVFLKVNLMVVYRTDEGSGEVMAQRKPFMRDLFNTYLRGLAEPDLRGMAGMLHVKAELLKRARAAVGSDLPQEVLINDLIVQ